MRAVSDELPTSAHDASLVGAHRAVSRTRRRLIGLVVALGVLVALATGWVVDAVGSVTPTQTRSPMTQQMGLSTVALTVKSPSGDSQALALRVTDVSGVAVDGAHLQCDLSMPGMAMSLSPIVATRTAQPGVYECLAPSLDPGAWSLALTLRLLSGETDHATFAFDVT